MQRQFADTLDLYLRSLFDIAYGLGGQYVPSRIDVDIAETNHMLNIRMFSIM